MRFYYWYIIAFVLIAFLVGKPQRRSKSFKDSYEKKKERKELNDHEDLHKNR